MYTTPYNSFADIPNPTKAHRKLSGDGSLHNTQQRLDMSLGFKSGLSENATFDIKAFYHLNRIKYGNAHINMAHLEIENQPSGSSGGGGSNDLRFNHLVADQSGSLFDDQKVGLLAKYDLRHSNGRFIAGVESLYNYAKRNMIANVSSTGPIGKYHHDSDISLNGSKWSNALYALEKYDFTQRFSLTGGARYEFASYHTFVHNIQQIMAERHINLSSIDSTKTHHTSLHNFALEFSPHFAYSDSGNVSAKYERGFFSPSSHSLIGYVGGEYNNAIQPDGFVLIEVKNINNGVYVTSNIPKKETYDSFELVWKDIFWDKVMLSANAFYTLTHNEFNTTGNFYALGTKGTWISNYNKTQRSGIELFSQQYFFEGKFNLSQSFTYIDARIKDKGLNANVRIPYVSNYKGTFGISLALGKHWNVWSQNTFYGNQKDISGESMKAYHLTDIGVNARFGDLSLNAGVRNVFDTFYYSYYNNDSRLYHTLAGNGTLAGYGFLIGQGRSAFIEGRYTF
ncbi:TonB-dependent receptor [Helicobacter sp. MIT 21-1697]|uniref:TonB-dependent receptor domain-containing protein n=1 Tax=Helicobacter sp. MIT 21-1697 TaxID=2993733 RepID=UPI00224B5DB8|nr:TonB-dependent receptor [Helicobacter sp. MIT 21-1697]MCX2716290.1 TonB-dependent receptor [Helicobacter sp. MIT 21-1697]